MRECVRDSEKREREREKDLREKERERETEFSPVVRLVLHLGWVQPAISSAPC